MAIVVDELEKKIVEEAKKLEPIVEAAFVEVVSGKTFGCWGWTLHISRTPKVQTPPKSEEPTKPVDTEVSPSVPASV